MAAVASMASLSRRSECLAAVTLGSIGMPSTFLSCALSGSSAKKEETEAVRAEERAMVTGRARI